MIDFSPAARAQFNLSSAPDPALLLLEISHPDLVDPVRVVNNLEDVVSNGDTFTACAFNLVPPSDLAQGQPRATLTVDNVGKVLTSWIENSSGGEGATVRIMWILYSDPDTIEFEVTMYLYDVAMDMFRVTGTLAFEDWLNRPGVTLTYRPDTAPGIF